ncbi:hypothetical protein niasHT_024972 [Heterodera trifolii]|uniref:MATH domain-containing protein n=1 Tax=Heterodera trifolii TaxID=157864 RepID=A0ABD2JAL1_9BILA
MALGFSHWHFPRTDGTKMEKQLRWKLKVSKFALEAVESYRLSDAVDIWGISLRITAEITKKNAEKWLGFLLYYDDPEKGFYNKHEDKVKLAIEVIINVPKSENLAFYAYKSNGTLSMEIEKVSEFAREIKESDRTSETVYLTGMPWKIVAKVRMKNESTEKWLDFLLFCDASEEDGNWTRECSATLRIISQKSGVFNNNALSYGFYFISFAELMEPSKGLYNKDEDKVTLAIDFYVNRANISRRIEKF